MACQPERQGTGHSDGRHSDGSAAARRCDRLPLHAEELTPSPISFLRSNSAPGLKPGLLFTRQFSLPADQEASSTARGAVTGVTVGDDLDPEFIRALVVRGGAGLAQRIQAVLRRTRGRCGESRQLEDHPRAGIQFREVEVHGRPFGGHLDLGTGSYVRAGYGVLLAIAAENDWRLSRRSTGAASSSAKCARPARSSGSGSAGTGRCTRTAKCRGTSTAAGTIGRSSRSAGTGYRTGTSPAGPGTAGSSGPCAPSAAGAAGATKIQAPDIALAHGSVPSGLELTGFCVSRDAVVDAVMDENERVGTPAERAVLVADHRGLISRAGEVVAAPLALHGREIHWLGVDEFDVLDRVIGANPEAGK